MVLTKLCCKNKSNKVTSCKSINAHDQNRQIQDEMVQERVDDNTREAQSIDKGEFYIVKEKHPYLLSEKFTSLPVPEEEASANSVATLVENESMEAVEAIDAAPTSDCDHATVRKPEIVEVGDSSTDEHHLNIHDQTIKKEMSVDPQKHISRIVVEKKSLQVNGGLSDIPGAQTRDLETGISENEAIQSNSAWKFSNMIADDKTNNLLLFLVATLTLGFGIMKEGKENGWQEGVILLITTFFVVLFASFHKYQRKRTSDVKSIVESQIDKLDKEIQVIGLVNCTLCLIASFLWDKFGQRDGDKESKHAARYVLNLLFVLLVGVTQKIPFVSVAIHYFNDHMLSGKIATVKKGSILVANMKLIRTFCICTENEMEVDKLSISKKKVKELRDRGIDIVMISRTNLSFLKEFALQSKVITDGDSESSMITGEDFRNLTHLQRLEKVGKIRVMGYAHPDDRLLLVKTLKERVGEVVEFMGKRTDGAPTLMASESGNSIIWDGSITDLISIVDAGRSMYANNQRFLQHYLIMFISSSLINLLVTAAFGDDAPLTTLDLLWMNLVEIILGGYMSLTKPSTDINIIIPLISGKQPSLNIITSRMTINISVQVSYQIICCMVLLRATGVGAMVSNSFILCQFFNIFIARELEKKNIFRGISGHVGFWIAGSIFIVLLGGFVKVEEWFGYGGKLDWKQWVVCFVIGLGSWLIDWLGKCIRKQ